jgi:hypothetical protein
MRAAMLGGVGYVRYRAGGTPIADAWVPRDDLAAVGLR